MRLILIISVFVAACLAASSSPIDPSSRLINWPSPKQESRFRVERSEQYVKGRPGGKTRPAPVVSLRKGEYWCGDKVCKLRVGDKPPCDTCQYPI